MINAAVFLLIVAVYALDPCSFIGAAILALLLFLVQMFIWRISRRFISSRKFWACFLIAPSILFACLSLYEERPIKQARYTLRDGRLADLPPSARNVKSGRWSNLFAGERYLCFEADKADVETFLANSPSLRGTKMTVYSRDFQRVPFSTSTQALGSDHTNFDHFVKQSDLVPAWWNEEVTGGGRAYDIPPGERGHNYGVVIYNEETGIVYVKVTWS